MTALRNSSRIALVLLAALMLAACGSTAQVGRDGQQAAPGRGSDVAFEDRDGEDEFALPQPGLAFGDGALRGAGSPGEGGRTGSRATPGGGTTSAGSTGSTGGDGTGTAGGSPPSGGVSGDPLKIGVVYFTGNPLGVIGMGDEALPTDAQKDRWIQAMVEVVNESGGFASRPVEAVIRRVDNTDSSQSTQEQLQTEACVSLTQDAQVFMVLAIEAVYRASQCYYNAQTPVFSLTEMGHAQELAERRPWIIPNMWLNLSRMARLMPVSLCQQEGWVNESIGIMAYDGKVEEHLVQNVMAPGFAQCGGEVKDIVFMSRNADDVAAQSASAVLRFRAAGIDRVAFLAGGGGAVFIFAQQAESQGYRPWYGINTNDRPFFFVPLMPAAQQENVHGTGFFMALDTSPQAHPPLNEREQACFDIYRERTGDDFRARDDVASITALGVCDIFWTGQAAFRPATGAAFARADVPPLFWDLGTSYQPALFDSVHFSRSRLDAVNDYANLRYDTDCQCVQYTSGWQRIPFE